MNHPVAAIFGFLAALAVAMPAAPIEVIVVAGQSNALNWHAAARALPPSGEDNRILFYYETGGAPDRGVAALNATSRGRWTTLRTQRQEPFVKFERDFFGPEMTLARRLSGTSPRLAVIKLAYFGTSLAVDWLPSATNGNQLYRRLQTQLSAAFQQLRERGAEPRLAGFFWMQGETDGANAAHADAYDQNLQAFIHQLRADLDHQKLPFILGRVGPRPPRGYHYQDTVRTAQVRVAGSTPQVLWVDTDDLSRDTDGIHLLADGMMKLGERMADAWLAQRANALNK